MSDAVFLLPRGSRYDGAADTLHGAARDDVFDACVAAWRDLVELRRRLPRAPARLLLPQPGLFDGALPGALRPSGKAADFDPGSDYRTLDFATARTLMAAYFQPARDMLDIEAGLLARHRIEPARTLAVVCPDSGGDAEAFLGLARRLLVRHPGFRVWIHAAQPEVRKSFCRAFGERCFFVHERGAAFDDPRRQMAAVRLLARCAVVISAASPQALWLALTRGHAQGAWQFDGQGRVLEPHRLLRYWSVAQRLSGRATTIFRPGV